MNAKRRKFLARKHETRLCHASRPDAGHTDPALVLDQAAMTAMFRTIVNGPLGAFLESRAMVGEMGLLRCVTPLVPTTHSPYTAVVDRNGQRDAANATEAHAPFLMARPSPVRLVCSSPRTPRRDRELLLEAALPRALENFFTSTMDGHACEIAGLAGDRAQGVNTRDRVFSLAVGNADGRYTLSRRYLSFFYAEINAILPSFNEVRRAAITSPLVIRGVATTAPLAIRVYFAFDAAPFVPFLRNPGVLDTAPGVPPHMLSRLHSERQVAWHFANQVRLRDAGWPPLHVKFVVSCAERPVACVVYEASGVHVHAAEPSAVQLTLEQSSLATLGAHGRLVVEERGGAGAGARPRGPQEPRAVGVTSIHASMLRRTAYPTISSFASEYASYNPGLARTVLTALFPPPQSRI